jgi:phenylacetate-CoA ligase
MLVIRGVNVYPSEVERVLLEDASLSPDYLLVVDERAAAPQLLAVCEYRAPASSGTASSGTGSPSPARPGSAPGAASGPGSARGEAEHEARLREVLGLRVRVKVLPPGTVPRTEVGKAVRVVRWAGGDPPVPGLG